MYSIRNILFSMLLVFPLYLQAVPAFPGAEGWGASSIGGRGGQVIHVTNLNSTGAGSFPAACAVSGPKIIVFDTGGVINMSNQMIWVNSNTTIAGQTAPGGITIVRGAIYGDRATNVIIRHVRIRRGISAADGDCFRFIDNAHDIILDHCSSMWNSDENLDISNGVYNITVQHCVVASPGQCYEVYGEGSGYGNNRTLILASRTAGRITFYKNLLAHSMKRTPAMQNDGNVTTWRGTTFEFINNVFYNCMQGGYETFDYDNTCPLNLVGNYYKPGPNASYPSSNPAPHCGTYPARMFVHASSNFHAQFPTVRVPAAFFKATTVLKFVDTMLPPRMTTVIDSAQDAYNEVTVTSGVLPHDAADARVLNEALTSTGKWQDTCEPTPDAYTRGTGLRPLDTDRDGMSDSWETAHGLNPSSATDAITDMDGYNAVEVYVNELADSLAAVTAIEKRGAAFSRSKALNAFPNPFNPSVTLTLPREAGNGVSLQVFDLSGRMIADLSSRVRAGKVVWNAAGTASGVYVTVARMGDRTMTKRIVYSK